jgi:hypothetical protein
LPKRRLCQADSGATAVCSNITASEDSYTPGIILRDQLQSVDVIAFREDTVIHAWVRAFDGMRHAQNNDRYDCLPE